MQRVARPRERISVEPGYCRSIKLAPGANLRLGHSARLTNDAHAIHHCPIHTFPSKKQKSRGNPRLQLSRDIFPYKKRDPWGALTTRLHNKNLVAKSTFFARAYSLRESHDPSFDGCEFSGIRRAVIEVDRLKRVQAHRVEVMQ